MIGIYLVLMLLTVILGILLLFVFRQKSYLLKVVLIISTFSISRVFFGVAWRAITSDINTIESPVRFYALLMFNFLILSVILIFAANRFTDESFRSLGWTDDNMVRNSLIGLVVGAGFFFVLSLSKKFEFHKLGPAIFFGFLIAAWQEENIFRGYLIKYLDERFDVEVTIIYQALIYSLCHIGFYLISPVINLIVSLVFAFIAGLVFGFLRLKTKSQIPGFLAHGIIDLAFLIT